VRVLSQLLGGANNNINTIHTSFDCQLGIFHLVQQS
jgi:hypothetical protein